MPSRIFQRAVLATAIAAAIALACAPVDAATVDPFAASPPKTTAPPPSEPARDEAPANQARDPDPPERAAAPAPATPAATGSPPATTASGNGTAHASTNTAPRECALSLEAAPFLRAATERGIQPRVVAGSACDMNPIDNEFFGRGGDRDCRLQFDNARWLREDMRFTAITGTGSFDARPNASGLEVSIPAEGGVRFRRVSVQARVRGGAECPAARPANVLAD
jgi:hypothetical protein